MKYYQNVCGIKIILKVKNAILQYAHNKGTLQDVDNAIQETLSPQTEVPSISKDEILQLTIRFHNAKLENKEWWNLEELLQAANEAKDKEEVLEFRRIVKKKLSALHIDPLVINLIRILIEDKQTEVLKKTLENYLDIMKKYRGEVEGSIISAQELDDQSYNLIKNALESANKGKKLTLTRVIDPNIGAGFIVKAGVQKFDFSLASILHSGRQAVSSQSVQ